MILVSGSLGAFMTTPGQTIGVSSFFDPLAMELQVSRTQVALAYSLDTLAGILPAPLIGRWIDRRGPRLTASGIVVAFALSCVAMASSNSALTLTIGFAVLRGSAVGGLSLVSQHVINIWFVHRRGIAAVAASLGFALGGAAFPQVIDALIRSVGWRRAYIALGAVVCTTMLPVVIFLFRDRPEKFGLTPDVGTRPSLSKSQSEAAFTREEAMRTAIFWPGPTY